MQLTIRRTCVIIGDKNEEAGRVSPVPQRKVAVVAIVKNPYLGGYVDDLSELVSASVPLGETMAELAREALGGRGVQSYGKGGIVGLSGEQEHANALLTTAFATPFRSMIGGGEAWISSMTKVAAPGALIDIPMNHKDDVYVRSHYDGMSLVLPDGPMPDEIAVIFCMASIGRLNARVGGLTHEEVAARPKGAQA
ncbi:amino acid synthesis family protein [Xanthobacter dioxanivorans]|uniref:Amino acid synthesis family protein n=1 Tax=Xanthobacter dioxanivorans TaxID=2528964 RepID=A0A974PSV8_9HYPH|nr:amino acid synthesis family protein [Xanthobacter dioxanivorans]QRG09090.1 amino acid synthesis family protein [Xanthobacter dioxanivorans]